MVSPCEQVSSLHPAESAGCRDCMQAGIDEQEQHRAGTMISSGASTLSMDSAGIRSTVRPAFEPSGMNLKGPPGPAGKKQEHWICQN